MTSEERKEKKKKGGCHCMLNPNLSVCVCVCVCLLQCSHAERRLPCCTAHTDKQTDRQMGKRPCSAGALLHWAQHATHTTHTGSNRHQPRALLMGQSSTHNTHKKQPLHPTRHDKPRTAKQTRRRSLARLHSHCALSNLLLHKTHTTLGVQPFTHTHTHIVAAAAAHNLSIKHIPPVPSTLLLCFSSHSHCVCVSEHANAVHPSHSTCSSITQHTTQQTTKTTLPSTLASSSSSLSFAASVSLPACSSTAIRPNTVHSPQSFVFTHNNNPFFRSSAIPPSFSTHTAIHGCSLLVLRVCCSCSLLNTTKHILLCLSVCLSPQLLQSHNK